MFMSKNITTSQQNGIKCLHLHLNLFVFLKICFKWVLSKFYIQLCINCVLSADNQYDNQYWSQYDQLEI